MKAILSIMALTLALLTPAHATAPALVLCADVNVYDKNGNSLNAPAIGVHYWGDVRGPIAGANAKAEHRWFHAIDPANEPSLVRHDGRAWVRLDGKSQWLGLGQILDSTGLTKIPTNTVFVVMSTREHPKMKRDSSIQLNPAATPDNPRVITEPGLIALYNPPETIIGDQSFQCFGELGLTQRRGFSFPFLPRVKVPAYRWSFAGDALHPGVTYAGQDRFGHDATTGAVHVLAVTHELLGGTPPRALVRLFYDGPVVFECSTPGGSAVGMTCIGGGYHSASVVDGKNVESSFQVAARLFAGDVAAVIAYDSAWAPEKVNELSLSLLRHSSTCHHLGVKVSQKAVFHGGKY